MPVITRQNSPRGQVPDLFLCMFLQCCPCASLAGWGRRDPSCGARRDSVFARHADGMRTSDVFSCFLILPQEQELLLGQADLEMRGDLRTSV